MEFQLLINLKRRKLKDISHSVVFILSINVKMPTIVGILTIMGRIVAYSVPLSYNIGPVFRARDKTSLKPIYSATKTSKNLGSWNVARLAFILSQKRKT